MGKEQRVNPRTTIAHNFNIHHESFGLVSCTNRDISISGMFIEGDFTSVSIGDTVGIGFAIPSKLPGAMRYSKEYTLNATVVRITGEGAGLIFIDVDLETSSALLKLRDGV